MSQKETISVTDQIKTKYAIITVCAVIAATFRIVRSDLGVPPNFELVTPVSFLSVFFLRTRYTAFIPLLITIISDAFLGNTTVALFTWSAWIIIGTFFSRFQGRSHHLESISIGKGAAISSLWVSGSTLFFYLWTNAGVWVLHRGTFYSAGLDGLIASYIAGLPFLRNQLLGNIAVTPLLLLLFGFLLQNKSSNCQFGIGPIYQFEQLK